MRFLRPFLVLSVAAAALAACSQPEPDHDVAYYRDHPDVRATKMAACRNDQGRLAATANCVNALAADSAATSKTFWTTPQPAARVQDSGKL